MRILYNFIMNMQILLRMHFEYIRLGGALGACHSERYWLKTSENKFQLFPVIEHLGIYVSLFMCL